MDLQIYLPEIIRLIACICTTFALFFLFGNRRTAILGPTRWFIPGAMAICAVFEAVSLAASWHNAPALALRTDIASACCVLLVALGLWPFLTHMNKSLANSINRKLQRRLDTAEAAAREAQRWMVLAEEIAQIGHWHYNIATKTVIWSEEVYRIHGIARTGKPVGFFDSISYYHPDDRSEIKAALESAIANKSSYELASRLIRQDGVLRHVMARAATQLDNDGNATAVFGVLLDITDQKRTEEKLRTANLRTEQTNKVLQELALIDGLTGLPNRRHFDATLESEFKRAARQGTSLGLIMIDLDRFKLYNDMYGHPAGDNCLRKVSAAIAGVPQRPGDLVARYGGEEIVVLLPGTTKEGAESIATRITRAVHTLGLAHNANPERVVTISCGVAVFNHAADALLPLNLVEHADQALYEAKLTGRNRISFYIQRAMTAY